MTVLAVLNAETNPEQFASRHSLHMRTGDGRELVVLSGNALVGIKGASSAEWLRGEARMVFQIGPGILSRGQRFRPDNWVVVMNPSSMWNKDQSINSGFAVDTFRMVAPTPNGPEDEVELIADVAVRDSDAYLYRISYQVTMVGTFA